MNQVVTGVGFSWGWAGAAVLAAASTYGVQRRLDAVDLQPVLRVRDGKGDAPASRRSSCGNCACYPATTRRCAGPGRRTAPRRTCSLRTHGWSSPQVRGWRA